MTPKIFATGTTGYLGGTVLHHLLTTHPDWESSTTCLIRSRSRGQALSSAYPSVKLVTGTLEDSQILEEEAAKADIVLHFASSDHMGAALAIKEGLERGLKNGRERDSYWIHTSGTDILLKPELLGGTGVQEGVKEVKVYDDWEGIKEITSFPETHSHRPCDAVPLSITNTRIKTAIICPPTIFAKGSGTGSTRSHQIYALAALTLSRGKGIQIPVQEKSKPKTFWPNVHVDDLARLYWDVVESAVAELEGKGGGKATWGEEGYYFAENGVHYWQDVCDAVAAEAHKQGYLKSGNVTALGENEKEGLKAAGPAIWNLGVSCKYIRAKKLFGWEPREKDLMDEIGEVVRSEAARAGMKRG